MSDFIAEIKSILTEYGLNASDLSVALAVELFKDLRSYPKSYDEAKKLADMENNKNKIAMAAAEIDAKQGIS